MKKLVLSLSAFVSLAAISDTKVVVKPGDQLAKLLQEYNLIPLYGKLGSVERTYVLNPKLKERKDLIIPGEEIVLDLSKTVEVEVETQVQVSQQLPAEEEFHSASDFTVKTQETFYRTDGKSGGSKNGTLGSSGSPSLELMWSPIVSEKTQFDFGARMTKVTLLEDKDNTLSGRTQTLNKIFIGHNYKFTEDFRSEVQLGYNDQLFYRNVSADNNHVQKTGVGYLQLGGRYRLGSSGGMNYYLRGAYRNNFPFENGGIKGKMSHGAIGAFQVEQQFKKFAIFAEVNYSTDKFNAAPVDFATRELGVAFGLRFRIGDSK